MNLKRFHATALALSLCACGPSPQELSNRIAAERAAAEASAAAKEAAIMAGPGVVARAIDKSVDARVGCVDGGDLYFEIGKHLVRVDPGRWAVSPYPPVEYWSSDRKILQACKAAPLSVPELRLAGPADRPMFHGRNLWLVDSAHQDRLHNLRADFSARETACRRGPHWTWCSDERTMKMVEKEAKSDDNAAAHPWVSLKIDRDHYSAPTGGAFFIADRNSAQWPLSRSVMYQWDEGLTIVSDAKALPCQRPAEFNFLGCDPRAFIESDRDTRQLVRELLDIASTAARTESAIR